MAITRLDERLAVTEPSVDKVKEQVQSVQHLLREVMKPNEHYGIIPGTGSKNVLLKPGAEKIFLLFNLAQSFDVERDELPGGHKEYRVTCNLTYRQTGQFAGQGIGSCSTLESKYRYVHDINAGENLEFTVPKDYWDAKNSGDKEAMRVALGGANRFVKKDAETGLWEVWERAGSDKIERVDIADVYNTCLKMAKKRASVDAAISFAAASDIFTQDIEEEEPIQVTAQVANATLSEVAQIPQIEVRPVPPLEDYLNPLRAHITEFRKMWSDVNPLDIQRDVERVTNIPFSQIDNSEDARYTLEVMQSRYPLADGGYSAEAQQEVLPVSDSSFRLR